MLLSGCLSVISDQSAMLQMSKVTGDAPAATQTAWTTHAYVHVGVVHATHLGGRPQSNYIDDHRWWELPHSDSIDRVPNKFREIYFPPGKFISRKLTTLIIIIFKDF